jgi:hypothetical protein
MLTLVIILICTLCGLITLYKVGGITERFFNCSVKQYIDMSNIGCDSGSFMSNLQNTGQSIKLTCCPLQSGVTTPLPASHEPIHQEFNVVVNNYESNDLRKIVDTNDVTTSEGSRRK